jgi:hypothetical protein
MLLWFSEGDDDGMIREFTVPAGSEEGTLLLSFYGATLTIT